MRLLLVLALLAQSSSGRMPEPLIVDLDGDGLALTSVQDGVRFDLDGDGKAEQTAWTTGGTDDAFLAIDENRNGWIDNGDELIGGGSDGPMGYAELRAMEGYLTDADLRADTNQQQDGQLTDRDTFYGKLVLWTDTNHNGRSEEDELESLSHAKMMMLRVSYRAADLADPSGNRITMQSQALRDNGKGVGVQRVVSAVRLAR